MLTINDNQIYLTRGDTAAINVQIFNKDGSEYTPSAADQIIFTMSKLWDTRKKLSKTIPNNTLVLVLASSDTIDLPCGDYAYDIRLKRSGLCDTFIVEGKITIGRGLN